MRQNYLSEMNSIMSIIKRGHDIRQVKELEKEKTATGAVFNGMINVKIISKRMIKGLICCFYS